MSCTISFLFHNKQFYQLFSVKLCSSIIPIFCFWLPSGVSANEDTYFSRSDCDIEAHFWSMISLRFASENPTNDRLDIPSPGLSLRIIAAKLLYASRSVGDVSFLWLNQLEDTGLMISDSIRDCSTYICFWSSGNDFHRSASFLLTSPKGIATFHCICAATCIWLPQLSHMLLIKQSIWSPSSTISLDFMWLDYHWLFDSTSHPPSYPTFALPSLTHDESDLCHQMHSLQRDVSPHPTFDSTMCSMHDWFHSCSNLPHNPAIPILRGFWARISSRFSLQK